MHLILLHLKQIAEVDEQLVRLSEGHHEGAEVLHELAQLIEDQRLEFDHLFGEFGLP